MIRVARAGVEMGGYSSADVVAGIKSGQFLYSDYFLEPGSTEWLPLSLFMPEVKKRSRVSMKTTFQPTAEQEEICKGIPGPGEVMLINAYAGSGKTETLRLIAERHPEVKFTYLCYNRDTADKAKKRFPKNVKCSTIHGLAYAAVGRIYKQDHRVPSAREVMHQFGVKLPYVAVLAVEAITRYCNSAEKTISELHVGENDLHRENILRKYPELVSLAQKVWEEMVNPESPFPMSHDGYLKLWSLRAPSVPGEVILHDESQDMNPVTLGILLEQKTKLNPALVVVGDSHQAIYAWRGAVNTMETLKGSANHVFKLRTSFRFGQEIADGASKLLQQLKGDDVCIRGEGPTKSDLPDLVYVARKNASLLEMAIVRMKENVGLSFHFAGTRMDAKWDPYYLYEFQKPLDLLNLSKGRPELVVLEQMKKFKSYDEVIALVEGDDEGDGVDRELAWFVEKLVRKYGDELPDLIDELRSRSVAPAEADMSFSTAHRSKGLEWKNVVMLDDFWIPREITAQEPLDDDEKQEVNAIYVAMTRASESIDYGPSLTKWLNSKGELK